MCQRPGSRQDRLCAARSTATNGSIFSHTADRSRVRRVDPDDPPGGAGAFGGGAGSVPQAAGPQAGAGAPGRRRPCGRRRHPATRGRVTAEWRSCDSRGHGHDLSGQG
ncbi:hypothetical protein GCM10010425_48690 [Streptomyces spororaveus]|uniref:Uncharacterized protein n=1 Tax=Streptomyces spororaveus TaxID=284039 RepID=A0ABQ3T8B1_9ACTN|nr:hypothetical protein Sspor_21650 [Streptomyces spororaveus]